VNQSEIRIDTGLLALTVNPGRGGRITSLRHMPTGKELLWRQPPLADWPRYDVLEADADIQGWDECFPAIGPGPHPPGPWGTVSNPAQGEVYALPWRVDDVGTDSGTLSVHGLRFPYHLTRRLWFDGPGTLRLSYRALNHGAHPLPFIWSAHPLLTAPAGARIDLPDSVREVILDSSEGNRLGAPYDVVTWPIAHIGAGAAADLRVVQPGSAVADKLYIPEIGAGHCSLVRNDGLTLTFAWDAETIPCLGVWIDTRGERKARVALEPCLGYPDQMIAAGTWGRHAVLPAYGELCWEFGLTITPTTP
jgi:galactose mutarotase-like enzyme